MDERRFIESRSELERPSNPDAEPTLFDANRGITGIVETVLDLKLANRSLQGSRIYTPEELANGIMDALVAGSLRTGEVQRSSQLQANDWVRNHASETYVEPKKSPYQFDSLPEVQALTRSGGLRAAVVAAMEKLAQQSQQASTGAGFVIPIEERQHLNALVEQIVGTPTSNYPKPYEQATARWQERHRAEFPQGDATTKGRSSLNELAARWNANKNRK